MHFTYTLNLPLGRTDVFHKMQGFFLLAFGLGFPSWMLKANSSVFFVAAECYSATPQRIFWPWFSFRQTTLGCLRCSSSKFQRSLLCAHMNDKQVLEARYRVARQTQEFDALFPEALDFFC